MTMIDRDLKLDSQILNSQKKSLYLDYIQPKFLPILAHKNGEQSNDIIISEEKQLLKDVMMMNSITSSQIDTQQINETLYNKAQNQVSKDDLLDYDQLEQKGLIYNQKWNTPLKQKAPYQQLNVGDVPLVLDSQIKNQNIIQLSKYKNGKLVNQKQQRKYSRQSLNYFSEYKQKLRSEIPSSDESETKEKSHMELNGRKRAQKVLIPSDSTRFDQTDQVNFNINKLSKPQTIPNSQNKTDHHILNQNTNDQSNQKSSSTYTIPNGYKRRGVRETVVASNLQMKENNNLNENLKSQLENKTLDQQQQQPKEISKIIEEIQQNSDDDFMFEPISEMDLPVAQSPSPTVNEKVEPELPVIVISSSISSRKGSESQNNYEDINFDENDENEENEEMEENDENNNKNNNNNNNANNNNYIIKTNKSRNEKLLMNNQMIMFDEDNTNLRNYSREVDEQASEQDSEFRRASSAESDGDEQSDRKAASMEENFDLEKQNLDEQDAQKFMHLLPISVITVGPGQQPVIPQLQVFQAQQGIDSFYQTRKNQDQMYLLSLRVWDSHQIQATEFDDCMDQFRETFGKERDDEELAAILQICNQDTGLFNRFIQTEQEQIQFWLQFQDSRKQKKQCKKLKRGRQQRNTYYKYEDQYKPYNPIQIEKDLQLEKAKEFSQKQEKAQNLLIKEKSLERESEKERECEKVKDQDQEKEQERAEKEKERNNEKEKQQEQERDKQEKLSQKEVEKEKELVQERERENKIKSQPESEQDVGFEIIL